MADDVEFVALGPGLAGFRTRAANINRGADIAGRQDGLRAVCFDTASDQGAGVVGEGHQNNGNGVIGIADVGDQAYGVWGLARFGFAGRFHGRVHVLGDLTVTGRKAAVVAFPDGSQRCLYAVESAESWFEDIGFGQLADGRTTVRLDPDFVAVIKDEPYHVFLSEYDNDSGLYVSDRDREGFDVRSRTPAGDGHFSYRVVARRGDVDATRFDTFEPDTLKSPRAADPTEPQDY